MSLLPYLSTTEWLPIGPAPIETPGVSMGFSSGRIEGAPADFSNADVMYIAAAGGGVWKTGDWNNSSQPPTWLPLSDDKPSLNFSGYHPLVVHPANHNLILGAVSGPGAAILKSSNGGLSWQVLANSQFEGASLGSLAVHPTDPKILYLSVWKDGVGGGGVYMSGDGGLTWQNQTAFHMGGASDVIVAKFDSQILYAGLIDSANTFSSDGVYRSVDGGASWQLVGGLPSTLFAGSTRLGAAARFDSAFVDGCVYASLFAVDKDGVVTVERYRTSDSGDSWTKLAPTPGTMEDRAWHLVLAVHPEDANHVFVNDAYALYESTDGGKTWSPGETIGDDWVNIVFAPGNAAVVTADRSVYQYSLQTKQWRGRAGNLQLTQFYDITVDPQDPDRVYGVAQDHPDATKFGGSVLWEYLPKGGGEHGQVLVDPADSDLLYVSDPLAFERLIQRSTDGGQSWTTILGLGIVTLPDQDPPDLYPLARATQRSFALDPSKPTRLLLGTTCVFETTDATSAQPMWAFSKELSPSKDPAERFITALAIAPSDSKTVYAATGDGHVWVTTKADVTAPWKQLDSGLFAAKKLGNVVAISVDPADAKQVFAVVGRGNRKNVWRLRHIGKVNDWLDVSGDLPKNLKAASIFVDWQYPVPALYVGTERGVYHSVDLGTHWHKFGLFLPNTLVADLQHVPSMDILAAGTQGRGAWEILISSSRISGFVFEDADGDGIRDANDKAMAGVTVFLDSDGNGVPDPFELSIATNARGHYVFAKVPPGTYAIRQVLPEGYRQTTPEFRPVTVGGSDLRQRDFGNRRDPTWVDPTYLTIADLANLPGRTPDQRISPVDEPVRSKP